LKVKKYLYAILLWGVTGGWGIAQRADTRTVETRIADLLTQVPAKDQKALELNATEVAALGKSGITELVSRMSAPGTGQNASIEYAIGGFTYFVNQPSREAWRKLATEAYAEALPRLKDKANQSFILFQLQQIDKGEALNAIVPFLQDAELAGPAARALVASGTTAAGDALLKALGNAQGNTKAHLVEALGDMKFKPSIPVIEGLVSDNQKNIRKVAQYSLAELAAPSSEALLRKAAESAGLVYDETNATASYLRYLTNLANNGEKALAEKSAGNLYTKASAAGQSHTKAAALSILAQAKRLFLSW
jgi:uncharacterized protein (UPF0147 family)